MKFKLLTMVAILAVLIIGSSSATVLAAQSALPGNSLYNVKTALEDMEVSLASSRLSQAKLHMKFAQTRLDEMASLAEPAEYDEMLIAARGYETHLSKASNLLTMLVAENDPQTETFIKEMVSFQAQNEGTIKSLLVLTSGSEDDKAAEIEAILTDSIGSNDDGNLNNDQGDDPSNNAAGNHNDKDSGSNNPDDLDVDQTDDSSNDSSDDLNVDQIDDSGNDSTVDLNADHDDDEKNGNSNSGSDSSKDGEGHDSSDDGSGSGDNDGCGAR